MNDDAARQEHLDFLWPTIQARPDVIAAHQLCQELDDHALRQLLRDHRLPGQGIDDELEIEQRAAVDYALQAYSLLAIAVIAGYVPSGLDETCRSQLRALLDRTPVRTYYEDFYRQLLPSLLRLHVTGKTPLPSDTGETAWGSFQWFVRFSGRFERDPNLDVFLGLLDGFSWDSLTATSFLDGLTDPATTLEAVVKRPDSLVVRDQAVMGMLRFFTFCAELAPALDAMKEAPLTQSACFFYYAYWFNEFKENVGEQTEKGLSVMERWLKSPTLAGTASVREGQRTIAQTRSAIHALLDGRFAAPLLRRLQSESHG
jgi:hypothetical protein